MKRSSVLLLFLLSGIFTSLAAKTLIGYTNESEIERRVRETAEEEFSQEKSKFLRIEQIVIETAEEEFDPFRSDVLRGKRLLARRINRS